MRASWYPVWDDECFRQPIVKLQKIEIIKSLQKISVTDIFMNKNRIFFPLLVSNL